MKRIAITGGARPNFMKIAPLYHKLKHIDWAETAVINTGQHYGKIVDSFMYNDLKLPKNLINLNVGSGTHSEVVANIMIKFEKEILSAYKPDMLVVVGDVNSTLACALSAVKFYEKKPIIVHVESGLRSFDTTMPEEINRVLVDSISDVLFTSCKDAVDNLIKMGIDKDRIYDVGNIMIDALQMILPVKSYNKHKNYAILTLHRPSNVDDINKLEYILHILNNLSIGKIIFPVHPRTKAKIDKLAVNHNNIEFVDPMGYVDFISAVISSDFVITDSGGLQEETTYLGIPCITLRENTERPITIKKGTNVLCKNIDNIEEMIYNAINKKKKCTIDKWDGKTSNRIIQVIKEKLNG